MRKGDQTRSEILAVALDRASTVGLEGLSIGTLASDVGMSKSGLFAHFGSKEGLQIAVLEEGRQRFVDEVIAPALKAARGEPRVRAMLSGWLEWIVSDEVPGGCVFASSAWEFDDRPGAVRDQVASALRDMLGTLARAARIAIEEGHFRADLDPDQFAYEADGLLMSFHIQARLLGRPQARERAERAFDRLIRDARAATTS